MLLAAAGVGLLSGHTTVLLALALAALLAFEIRNLLRFERWLRRKDVESPPDITGLWGVVVAITSRLHRRKLFHEQRVTAHCCANFAVWRQPSRKASCC